ncbi:MAG: hypothetical protein JNJ46_23975 [Myxococcales bacterium]|nr:hypothetical protein [Myxococcales bacterium]
MTFRMPVLRFLAAVCVSGWLLPAAWGLPSSQAATGAQTEPPAPASFPVSAPPPAPALGDVAAPLPPPPVVDEPAVQAPGPASPPPPLKADLLLVRPVERVLVDQLAGGPTRGAWGISLQGGYPFFSLRALVGVRHGLAPLVEVETALARRFTTSLGLSLAWVRRPHLRLSGEVLLGWLLQESELPRRGPSGELRLRLGIPTRWVMPYLVLGTRHALLPSRTRIERASGIETTWSVQHEWTPTASLGLGIHIHRRVGLDLGADYGWVDAPQSIAIPGFHIGLHVGGGR